MQKAEASYLLDILHPTYNHKILQVGPIFSENQYISDESRRDFILLSASADGGLTPLNLTLAYPDQLPIATASIDTAILPHLLEFENEPRAVLAEIERVLKPGGHLHILGLNPWSLSGLFKRLPPFQGDMRDKLIAHHRLIDWLNQLSIEAEWQAGFDYSLDHTIRTPATLFGRSMAHLAAAYAIRAIKRTCTLTPVPLKARWISTPSLVPEGLLDTTSGVLNRKSP